MDINLELILVLGTLLSGVIWLLDWAWLKKWRAKSADDGERVKEPWYVEYAKSFFPVFLAVLLVRGFIFEPFRIPSSSMLPTLEVNDLILVNKFSYGLRLPLVHYRFFSTGHPESGDVMVFRYPNDPSINYIKRVIGTPGDRVGYFNKRVYINGELLPLTEQGVYEPGPGGPTAATAIRYREQMGDQQHDILWTQGRLSGDFETTVPEGKYLVLGDNRDNSNDSRYWGYVPEENLVGRASYIWMNLNVAEWPGKLARIGTSINQ